MAKEKMYFQTVVWHGMTTGFADIKEVWVLFRNELTNNLVIRNIVYDDYSGQWYYKDDDIEVEFNSKTFIPIAWTSSFGKFALKEIEGKVND